MGRQVGSRRAGRPHTSGTVLARVMRERDIKMVRVAAALNVSHNTLYNYLKRKSRLSPLQAILLGELLDANPEALVQSDGLLLMDKGEH